MTVDTLLEWYALATADERAGGESWYREARACAEYVGSLAGRSVDVGAAVLATLSPQAHWNENQAAAITLAQAYRDRAPMPESIQGIYGANIMKAWRILQSGTVEVCGGYRVNPRGRVIR